MDFIKAIEEERARLNKRIEELDKQQEALDAEMLAIRAELRAIEAYEAAKAGKPAATKKTRAPRKIGIGTAVIDLLKQNPEGMKRKDIIKQLSLNANTNLLSTLKSSGSISLAGGLYRAV